MTGVEGAIPLADFIADLRRELATAQQDAADEPLKLGVEEITLTLDVAFSATASGEVSGKASVRFLVFLSGEAAAKAAASGQRSRSHTVTLTMKPRLEETVVAPGGQHTTVSRTLDVVGGLADDEEKPRLPPP
jgi:hypothetical protein